MTAKRLSLPSLSAILFGSFTLWVSFGTLGVTSAETGSWRVAVLPSGWWFLAALAVVSLAGVAAGGPRSRLLWLPLVLLLPWLPVRVPAVAYIWTGPLRWGVWCAIAVAMLGPRALAAAPARSFRPFADPRRAPLLAATSAAGVSLRAAR